MLIEHSGIKGDINRFELIRTSIDTSRWMLRVASEALGLDKFFKLKTPEIVNALSGYNFAKPERTNEIKLREGIIIQPNTSLILLGNISIIDISKCTLKRIMDGLAKATSPYCLCDSWQII